MAASADEFKQVMSRWASGVSVVTTNDDGMLYGLTVSSFSSVSLDPPLIMVCLNRSNRIVEMIERSGKFAVSILGTHQEAASNYFARPRREPTPTSPRSTDDGSIWSSRWSRARWRGLRARCTSW